MSLNALMRFIKPHEMIFFDLLDAAAENLFQAAELFDRGIRLGDPARWADLRRDMKVFEHRGDEHTHEILEKLSQAFITPIEKEDIQDLAHALDDAMDCVDAVAERLVIYRIGEVRTPFLEMSSLVVEASRELMVLVRSLRRMSDPKDARDRIRYVRELENRSDAIYHTGLGEIFQDGLTAVELVKWKELLDTMEEAVDAIDRAAQVVGATLMKNA